MLLFPGSGDFLETGLPALCKATTNLSVDIQAKLAIAWSGSTCNSIRNILENLQQLITLRVILTRQDQDIEDDYIVTSATKLMKVKHLFLNLLRVGVVISILGCLLCKYTRWFVRIY